MEDTLVYGKKEVKVCKIEGSSLFCVQFTKGGELPKELAGRWTSAAYAAKAVEEAEAKRA